jgi:hypothetical protein
MSAKAGRQPRRPLGECLVTLAGRADDNPHIAADLVDIAILSADRIAGVSYASVTSRYEGAYATVAASSALAIEVDKAQYAGDAGPCLDALAGDDPVVVPDIAATITWPGFRDVAFRLGLRASLSIPLFAGRGTPIAALNLYAHDADAMKVLAAAVWSVYDVDTSPDRHFDDLDAGGNDLIAGLAGAFAVRAHIQRAIGVLISVTGFGADQAFLALCRRAAETGAILTEEAARLLAERTGEE